MAQAGGQRRTAHRFARTVACDSLDWLPPSPSAAPPRSARRTDPRPVRGGSRGGAHTGHARGGSAECCPAPWPTVCTASATSVTSAARAAANAPRAAGVPFIPGIARGAGVATAHFKGGPTGKSKYPLTGTGGRSIEFTSGHLGSAPPLGTPERFTFGSAFILDWARPWSVQ